MIKKWYMRSMENIMITMMENPVLRRGNRVLLHMIWKLKLDRMLLVKCMIRNQWRMSRIFIVYSKERFTWELMQLFHQLKSLVSLKLWKQLSRIALCLTMEARLLKMKHNNRLLCNLVNRKCWKQRNTWLDHINAKRFCLSLVQWKVRLKKVNKHWTHLHRIWRTETECQLQCGILRLKCTCSIRNCSKEITAIIDYRRNSHYLLLSCASHWFSSQLAWNKSKSMQLKESRNLSYILSHQKISLSYKLWRWHKSVRHRSSRKPELHCSLMVKINSLSSKNHFQSIERILCWRSTYHSREMKVMLKMVTEINRMKATRC